jgi:Protein of unknown function (DUF1501)
VLTVWGSDQGPLCNGFTRRDFLRIGALGAGGLALPDLLRLQAKAAQPCKVRSVIMVCLIGGPSHIDLYDMKPDAPAEIRGEFRPIRTNVPGFDICEHMPLHATMADKLALIRSVQFVEPVQHELQEIFTGFPKAARRPAFGSVISRFGSHPNRHIPAYAAVSSNYGNRDDVENPQYIGSAHRPLFLDSEGVQDLRLTEEISLDRLRDRRQMLTAFDGMRREVDAGAEVAAIDAYTARALEMITSPEARDAFDLSREPESTKRRYGIPGGKYSYDTDPTKFRTWPAEKFLLARRLVEAGVSAVTLVVGNWDYHGTRSGSGNSFNGMRGQVPLFDRSLHALVTDLHERGLDDEVAVLVWGEFGRTPRINQFAGRDHWPEVGMAMFAGGGLKTGQVIGSTDRQGARATSRPLSAQNVFATLYRLLGIDPGQTLPDFNGRPQFLLDDREPIAELI